MLTMKWYGMVGCVLRTKLVMTLLIDLLTLVREGSLLVSLMLNVCALQPVGNGTCDKLNDL